MEITEHFREWKVEFATDSSGEMNEFYYDACERVPEWLETNFDDIHRFRDELAAHIRDSSYGPLGSETQWGTDEILRDLWFDVFGIDSPPGDPYPVPPERWARNRMTKYMQDIPWNGPELIPQAKYDWLAARGLTLDDLGAYRAPGAVRDYSRPEPAGYRERLAELTAQGLRSGSAEGEHAARARADLLDAKQAYLDSDRPDLAGEVDTILTNRESRDD